MAVQTSLFNRNGSFHKGERDLIRAERRPRIDRPAGCDGGLTRHRPAGRPWAAASDAALGLVQVTSPAARHAKIGPAQVAAAKRGEDLLDVAAEVRDDLDPLILQATEERCGDGGAQQHINVQLAQAVGERAGRQQSELDFAARPGPTFPPADDEQAGGRIEDRRHPALTDWNRDQHGCPCAACLPDSGATSRSTEPVMGMCVTLGIPGRRDHGPSHLAAKEQSQPWQNASLEDIPPPSRARGEGPWARALRSRVSTVAFVERVLQESGVLSALARPTWLP